MLQNHQGVHCTSSESRLFCEAEGHLQISASILNTGQDRRIWTPDQLILLLQVRESEHSTFVPQAELGVDNDADLYSDAEDMDEET